MLWNIPCALWLSFNIGVSPSERVVILRKQTGKIRVCEHFYVCEKDQERPFCSLNIRPLVLTQLSV